MLRHAAAALLERAAERRLVLLVDDAHLLDDASATLVHQLALTNAAFVLATVRTGEPAPDAIAALWKDGLVERIDLPSLSAEAIEELLTSVLGGPVDRAAMVRLGVRSQGNALFLRELLLGALADGTLRDDGGIWRLVGPLSPSSRLVELVEARLAGLEAPERALLELVAFGEPLGPAELAALGDPTVADRLERQSLLASHMDGRRVQVRLAHPLYGDVVRARIPVLSVRDITRALAESVEATGARRRDDNLRVAAWRLTGGGVRAEPMLAAATTARWRYDFPLAERLARAAGEAGAGFDAALLVAQLASLQGRREQAETELAELAACATADAQQGAVTLARLDNAIHGLVTLDDAWRIAGEAEAKIADQRWRDEIAGRRAWVSLIRQGPRAAAEAAAPLFERTQGRALVWASIPFSRGLSQLGHLNAAFDAASKGRSAHLATGEHLDWYPWVHSYHRCLAHAYAGRFGEAELLARAEYEQALSDGSLEAQAYFSWFFAGIVGERGRVRTAASHAREAIALFRQLARPRLLRACVGPLALALALSGQPREADAALAELDQLGRPDALWLVDLMQAQAWSAAAAGDLPRARSLLDEAGCVGVENGSLIAAVIALHGLARLGDARRALPRLTALAEQIEGDLTAARVAHVDALIASDPARLESVSASFEVMGADLLAAEAAADAAVAWQKAGDSRRSATAQRRAAAIADRCEGATTPALQATDPRARLTIAERETALLAAAGRSNRDIAVELSISKRTVESRLQHVYEKLGVTGREELEAILSEGAQDTP
jgi:DNA-binding CsgD family transcriptional regulator